MQIKMQVSSLLAILLAISASLASPHTEFAFGAATSAYQVEGAWLEGGKSLSVWDNLVHTPGIVDDNSTGDIGPDSYHRYTEDIALMKEYGIKHYRTHIPWCRVVPGVLAGSPVNMKAVEHYRAELQAYKEAGITVYVNLLHANFPAYLDIYGGGMADEDFPVHFAYYADVCFKYFGDLVQYWFTFDEPYSEAIGSIEPPGRETNKMPYIVGHNVLLAHAAAVEIYRRDYKPRYNGQIGVNLYTEGVWPNSTEPEDIAAAKRALTFQIHWFADPIFFGDYPELMKQRVGDRLPRFTEDQKRRLRGSLDFFAFNHYCSYMAADGESQENKTFSDDVNVTDYYKPEWKRTDLDWSIVPEGLHDTLLYIKEQWVKNSSMPIWVTENGIASYEPTRKIAMNDTERINFMYSYLKELGRAKTESGVNVVKYFAWSLLDNFEGTHGFSKRFGLVRVEVGNEPKRIPKSSINWYSHLINEYN